jgi:hypothetical protein
MLLILAEMPAQLSFIGELNEFILSHKDNIGEECNWSIQGYHGYCIWFDDGEVKVVIIEVNAYFVWNNRVDAINDFQSEYWGKFVFGCDWPPRGPVDFDLINQLKLRRLVV